MSLINWHDSGRTLQIRTALLTTRQRARLEAMFAEDVHVPVEVTWLVYQQVITAYAHPDPREGAKLLHSPDLERVDEAMTGRLEALRRSSWRTVPPRLPTRTVPWRMRARVSAK